MATTRSFFVIVTLGFVWQTLLYNSVSRAEELDEACKNVLTEIIQKQMAALKECMEEMKFKNGKEKVQKMMCVMKCSLKKERFLDKEGNVDLIGAMNFLDKLPQNVKEKALHLFMECHEHVGKVDPNEESCKSYEPMLQCCQAVINKLCYIANEPPSGGNTTAAAER